LWDLRERRVGVPVATYNTPTLNVMCCFSPNDDSLLVSGLDNNVCQLDIRKGLMPNLTNDVLAKSIPARNSTTNYRRSVYTADGNSFITSGTDENFMRVIDSKTGSSTCVCKFDGLLASFEERLAGLGRESVEFSEVKNDDPGAPPLAAALADPTNHKAPEYVQSLRGHPIFPNEVGVLLYPFDRASSSYICTTRIPPMINDN